MSRKNIDGKENVRILAWRQENVIMKKSADVLRAQGHTVMILLAAARHLLQDVILANKPQSGRPQNTSNHTDDVQGQDLRRNPRFSASELKEIHQDLLGNFSIRCIYHRPKKDLKIPS